MDLRSLDVLPSVYVKQGEMTGLSANKVQEGRILSALAQLDLLCT